MTVIMNFISKACFNGLSGQKSLKYLWFRSGAFAAIGWGKRVTTDKSREKLKNYSKKYFFCFNSEGNGEGNMSTEMTC